MERYYKDLPPELANALDEEIASQTRQTFDKGVETDWKLTQHNFLVNAGGAAAVLAYMGSTPTPKFAIWPLSVFLVGVIASGFEIRALLNVFRRLHSDALRRRSDFASNKITVTQLGPSSNVGGVAAHINQWCGWIAQLSFVVGVLVGIYFFL